jgi:hypothetical protein
MYRWYRENKVAQHDDDAAKPDGFLRPDDAIRDPATWQRNEVNGSRIQTVNGGCRCVAETKPAALDRIDHEKNEQGPHTVVAESLPHLCKKQRIQASWVCCSRYLGSSGGF